MVEKSNVISLTDPTKPPYDPNQPHAPINAYDGQEDNRTIYERLSAVMNEISPIAKDSWNDGQKFKFRGVDAVVAEIHPLFKKHGVMLFSMANPAVYATVPQRSGSLATSARLTVQFTLVGLKGDYHFGVADAEANDNGDKATAKAMSVALRTFLLQTFLIPTGDTDADSENYDRGGNDVKKLPPTPEQVKQIEGMIAEATTVGMLKAAGKEMLKYEVSPEQSEIFFGLYQVRLGEINKPKEEVSDDLWSTKKSEPAPTTQVEEKKPQTAVQERYPITEFASSVAQVEKLQQAQTDFLGADTMAAAMKVLTANPVPDVGFPSIETGEMTSLRWIFESLPIVITSKTQSRS